ncbi:MAG: tetratricopeptide repeat protein [Acidobacteriota bacterium]
MTRTKYAILRSMAETFNYGMSYYHRHRKPLVGDPARLAQAFAYLNACVDATKLESNFEETEKRIGEGRHPSSGRPFVVVGSFMAQTISEKFGESYLESLHGKGVIPFFNAYVKTYEAEPDFPKSQQLYTLFKQLIETWQRDWKKTWAGDTQQLALTVSSDFSEVGRRLKNVFSGAEIYPDYVNRLSDLVEGFYFKGQPGRAAEVARMAVSLYPRSGKANVTAGLVYLGGGDREKAASFIRTAKELNNGNAASAGALNSWAYRFKGMGQLELGLTLLGIALELYPEVANLYDSTGEFHLASGDKQKAIAYYQKALEVDPNFENAKRMLAKIRNE